MSADNLPAIRSCSPVWNKGRIVGQKRPLMPKHVWAIRVRLEKLRQPGPDKNKTPYFCINAFSHSARKRARFNVSK